MKDLEKIKSEDLAAQVQDANPANFAIEQEVAQLVGATVPQPTEPSADDARELGAQLLVFLRRALTPIQTALRTAVAAIYAHLDSRCTDYTPAAYAPYIPRPYDPMGTPPTPRTLPNLFTAITAFDSRKISNGSATADGIPDGTSLAHLLCSTAAANSVTEIVDDNYGWTMDRQNYLQTILNAFPNVDELHLNCSSITQMQYSGYTTRQCKIYFDDCKSLIDNFIFRYGGSGGQPNFEVHIHGLEELPTFNWQGGAVRFYSGKVYIYDFKKGGYRNSQTGEYTNSTTTYILSGCKGEKTDLIHLSNFNDNNTVIDIEIGDKELIDKGLSPRWVPCQSITIERFTGLTAENMYNHILLRLKQDEPMCGSGVTITLGTTNIEKLEAVEEYNTKLTELEDTYGYTFA